MQEICFGHIRGSVGAASASDRRQRESIEVVENQPDKESGNYGTLGVALDQNEDHKQDDNHNGNNQIGLVVDAVWLEVPGSQKFLKWT